MPAFRQFFGDSQRDIPGDVARGGVHGDQVAPGGLVARPGGLAAAQRAAAGFRRCLVPPEARQRAVDTVAPVVAGIDGIFFDPAEAAFVHRVHEDVAQIGVGRRAAPVGAADGTGEDNGRRCAASGFAKSIGGIGPVIPETAAFLVYPPTELRVLFVGVLRADDVVRGEIDLGDGGRFYRDRLGRRGPFTRRVALGHRMLLDTKHGLPGLTIQDIHVAGFSGQCQDRHRLAVDLHVQQARRRGQVEVPEVVVNGLVVPAALAGADIQRHDGVAEQVVPGAVAAVIVRGPRALEGGEHQLPLFVHGQGKRPVEQVGLIPPGVAFPGVVPELAGLWRRMKGPGLRSRAHVEGAHAPGTRVGADQQQVLENDGRPNIGHGHGARGGIELFRKDGQQLRPHRDEQHRLDFIVGGAPGESASRRRHAHFVAPELIAGVRLERGHVIGARQVHDAVDHQRNELRAPAQIARGAIAPEFVGPGFAELVDVFGVDLSQRRVSGTGQIAVVAGPVAGLGSHLGDAGCGNRQHGKSNYGEMLNAGN